MLKADGAGSRLDLSQVTMITGGTHYDARLSIEATGGGTVDLGSVVHVAERSDGDQRSRSIDISSQGAGSTVLLSSLQSIVDPYAFETSGYGLYSLLQARAGGAIVAPQLTRLDGVNLVLDGTGVLAVGQLETLLNGRLVISGAGQSFPSLTRADGTAIEVQGVPADFGAVTRMSRASVKLTGGGTADLHSASDIDGASFDVGGGVTLALPGATHYELATTGNNQHSRLAASGAGSRLDLSGVGTITGGSHYDAQLFIAASAGGSIDLRGTRQIVDRPDGDQRYRAVHVTAQDANSRIRTR